MIYGNMAMSILDQKNTFRNLYEILEMSVDFQSDICMIYTEFINENGIEMVQEGAIKDFFSKIFTTIKNLITKSINFIKDLFTKFTNFIKEKVGGLKKKQKKARETINDDEFWDDSIFDDDDDEEEIERVSGEVEDTRRNNSPRAIEQKNQTKMIERKSKRNNAPHVSSFMYNIKYKDYVVLIDEVEINSNNFDAITDAANDMRSSYEVFAPALDAARRNDQKKINEIGKKVFGNTRQITLTGKDDIRRASELISGFSFSGVDALVNSENYDDVSELVKVIRDFRNQAQDEVIREKMEKSSANKIMDQVDTMIKELDRVSSMVKSNSEIVNNKFKSALQLISKTEKDIQKYSDVDVSKLTSSSDYHGSDRDWTIGDLFAGFKENIKTNTKRITDLSTVYNVIFSEIIFITSRGYNEANKIIHMVCNPNAVTAA